MRWYHILAKVCKFLHLYYLIPDREGNDPYLHRYYLLSSRWLGSIFPKLSYRLVLHNCVKSDIDGLHDHPWDWGSKILEGGYYETLPLNDTGTETKRVWRDSSGGWRFKKADDLHRLELPHEGASCWTLFLMGPRQKKWGFLDKNGNWVEANEYINNRQEYIDA